MPLPDIAKLTAPELAELKTHIDTRIAAMREEGAPQLFDEFSRKAAALGLSLDEVCGNGKRRKRRHPRRAFSLFRKRAPVADKTVESPAIPVTARS